MKIIRKTAIVMLLCLYFLTYGVLPQVQAAGKDAPVIVVAHRAGAKVAPENTVAALEQAMTVILNGPQERISAYGMRRQMLSKPWKWAAVFRQHTGENRSRHWKKCLPVPEAGSL